MSKAAKLSGFPEWLPQDRIIEERVLDLLKHTFELNGFAAVNVRAVEPLSILAKDGEIDKEIFTLGRLHSEGKERNPLGLHFDLTVPTARYVLENAGHLNFPFKRYSIQPVWRGERPQDGRFREFIQADIDVIGDEVLADHFEVEIPLVMVQAFDALRELGVPEAGIVANNRKLLEGFARGLGLDDVTSVLRAIDKLDKIGPEKVEELLIETAGADQTQAKQCLRLAEIESGTSAFAEDVIALGVEHPLLNEGIATLVALLDSANRLHPGAVKAQLKIARGLDYYTGTVYETFLKGHESLGSVASGGRYDALAKTDKKVYPGVGMSLGVSRLMSRLVGANRALTATRGVPTAVLVAVTAEDQRPEADQIATALRRRGIPVDVSPSADKFGKQIRFAERRGIPFVWFPSAETGSEVKDIRTGEQVSADPDLWAPPEEDIWPRVLRVDAE
ncbi:histidine--tRNA ligase [Brevibacterium sp. HMSC08F02]|uniref:Histidine--tRNA ligase n=1 Tax=Brevibacterium ravenspurgense TaxID=479117 RepID=A0A150H7T6_9MICO|nr:MULTISPECIES: histidine--tRNA ligase [Brevibacterium]KXZ58074.1 Histidine--tRNA ligase [Brevibacterium ravenspurgense]MCG7299720.1 histidine--tRNA ligase [Brevibacterium ravenspurgense]OFT25344.1 histidine--tRNA ligase [Brevibacterium sp. HMSC08F02]PKY69715.1 histidine--tRNA ligase [Brevibacterium ravenspurgense]